jgi:hypothetical protein
MKHVHLEQSPREGLGEGYEEGARHALIRNGSSIDG